MTDDPANVGGDRRLRPLSAREGRHGTSPRYEGLPPHLELPIRNWARGYMERDTEERIALLLEVVLSPRGRVHRTVSPPENLVDLERVDLLDVVDLALQIQGTITHRAVNADDHVEGRGPQAFEVEPVSTAPLDRLDRLLDDGGSVYRVNRRLRPPRLTRRADPSTDAAFEHALDTTEQTASGLLARAWSKAYSRDTDPDGAYFDALRAVEASPAPSCCPTAPAER